MIAGFLIEIKGDAIKSARICFGGIESGFIHAAATEEYLIEKDVHSNEVLSEALNILSNEVNPDENSSVASIEYRQGLATALFFKFILSALGTDGIDVEPRGISMGAQDTATSRDKWPLTKDIPNVDGLRQAAGEVRFVNDLPLQTNELWAAFVPATVINARITNIDASEALVNIYTRIGAAINKDITFVRNAIVSEYFRCAPFFLGQRHSRQKQFHSANDGID